MKSVDIITTVLAVLANAGFTNAHCYIWVGYECAVFEVALQLTALRVYSSTVSTKEHFVVFEHRHTTARRHQAMPTRRSRI